MKKALVVLSGGQDSTTCLYWAINRGYEVHAVTFNYGQRHFREIECATRIAAACKEVVSHEVITLPDGILASTSPLVSGNELEQYESHAVLPGGLEKTFVPMRNQLFLTIAANRAYAMGSSVLVTGVCEEDSGGYPDCHLDFIVSLEDTCSLGSFTGMDGAPDPLIIHTPLMHMSKADSVLLALDFKGCYAALANTQTGYDGAYPPTGKDHATLLRQKGFEEAGIPDPMVLKAYWEGLMDLPDTPNYSPSRVEIYGAAAGFSGLALNARASQ